MPGPVGGAELSVVRSSSLDRDLFLPPLLPAIGVANVDTQALFFSYDAKPVRIITNIEIIFETGGGAQEALIVVEGTAP